MSVICYAHKKVGVELLYNSVKTGSQLVWRPDQLEIRCGRENQHPERLGPQGTGWAGHKSGGQYAAVSNSLSHSETFSNPFEPFQIKWEVYFSKELCHLSLLCRRYDSACRCVCIVVMAIQHNTCSSVWRSLLENVAYELALTSPAVSCMSCSPFFKF